MNILLHKYCSILPTLTAAKFHAGKTAIRCQTWPAAWHMTLLKQLENISYSNYFDRI